MLKNKFIVFDRDGTLIRYVPYLNNPLDVELIPGAKIFINNLLKHSNILFLHTNQSGVSRGYFSLDQVEKCNEELLRLLGLGENLCDKTCIATELESSKRSYRKPSPLFANEILCEYRIKKSDLVYIGDNIIDLETAHKIGCNAYGIINKKLNQDLSKNNFGFKIFESINDLNKNLYG